MDWFVFWIILYSIIIIVLTIKHIKLRSIEKYLINDRRTRTIPLVFSTLATFIGGGVSVGLIAIGYEAGFVGVAIGIAFVIGFFIIARFASRINAYGKKFSIYSFSGFLNRNYTKENDPFFSKLFSSIVSTINIFIFFFLLSASSGKTAKRASIISGLGMLPFYIIFPLVGMAVRLGHDEMIDPKFAAHTFLAEHCNDFLLGFAIVGLISALMSSGDSFLNIISISAVKDYIGWKKPKKKSDKNGLYVKIKIATLIFGFLALIKKNVYLYRKVAILSIVTGFIVNIIFFVFGIISPEIFEPKSSFVPAFIVSFLTLVIGLAIVRRKSLNLYN